MGLGIMALPASVATLGWGPGLATLLAMFALNLYTGLLLWRLRVACPGAMSYTHLGAEVSDLLFLLPSGGRGCGGLGLVGEAARCRLREVRCLAMDTHEGGCASRP